MYIGCTLDPSLDTNIGRICKTSMYCQWDTWNKSSNSCCMIQASWCHVLTHHHHHHCHAIYHGVSSEMGASAFIPNIHMCASMKTICYDFFSGNFFSSCFTTQLLPHNICYTTTKANASEQSVHCIYESLSKLLSFFLSSILKTCTFFQSFTHSGKFDHNSLMEYTSSGKGKKTCYTCNGVQNNLWWIIYTTCGCKNRRRTLPFEG